MAKVTDDGFSQPGFIEGVPGLYPDLRFTFRMMLRTDVADFFDKTGRVKAGQGEKIAANTMAEHISDWSMIDQDGDPVPINGANMIRPNNKRALPTRLFNRLLGIITGMEPSDIDPKWSDVESNGHLSDITEAQKQDRPIGAVVDEERVKN